MEEGAMRSANATQSRYGDTRESPGPVETTLTKEDEESRHAQKVGWKKDDPGLQSDNSIAGYLTATHETSETLDTSKNIVETVVGLDTYTTGIYGDFFRWELESKNSIKKSMIQNPKDAVVEDRLMTKYFNTVRKSEYTRDWTM